MTTVRSNHSTRNTTVEAPLSEGERNAMRAYLQRCEVRLSTLHRIATAFIGGAGLLLLIPVFFKDAFDNLLSTMLAQLGNHFPAQGNAGIVLTIILYVCLLYPLFLSLVVPIYGVYLLLKDIIHFYFTIYTPGFPENLQNPTFALTGVLFSTDESPAGHREVMRYQYDATQMGFMIPFSQERKELYFDSIIETTDGDIIPKTRQVDVLEKMNVLPEQFDEINVNRFNAALGIARSIDRTLAQEVAVTEMSLVRHVLYLRRLMLRYVKTLLMFIWTTIISFMMLPFLKDSHFAPFIIFGLGYVVWALAVRWILDFPLYWIYRHRRSEKELAHVDPQLRLMQEVISPYGKLAIASAVIGLMLAVLAQVA
jgi:hypothetical protein